MAEQCQGCKREFSTKGEYFAHFYVSAGSNPRCMRVDELITAGFSAHRGVYSRSQPKSPNPNRHTFGKPGRQTFLSR